TSGRGRHARHARDRRASHALRDRARPGHRCPMIGRTIGRYLILAKLGEGGMATVWEARDKLLERTVALKLLLESFPGTAEARRRFRHEARAASALDHPGIAQVFDAGEADGLLYIAYAYVDGRTLSDLVREGPLPVGEAVRIACAAAD